MSAAHQSARHVRAHAAEAYHSQLHILLLQFRRRPTCLRHAVINTPASLSEELFARPSPATSTQISPFEKCTRSVRRQPVQPTLENRRALVPPSQHPRCTRGPELADQSKVVRSKCCEIRSTTA